MKILIVDDDEVYAHMLAEKLHQLEPDFLITAAPSAAAARTAVKETDKPFDVFLLDQQLDGSDVDGIKLMQELFRTSADSDAILLTAHDDPESGLRAFEAGAYRYLPKPFDSRELVSILKVLGKMQTFRREGNWLRILSEVGATAQQVTTVIDVGDALCRGAQRLGFDRARLWKVVGNTGAGETLLDDTEVEGVSEAGHNGLKDFRGLRLKLQDLPYSRKVLASGEAGFFVGRPEVGGLERHYGETVFKPPVGEWAKLPLFVGKRCIGFLVLDNAEHEKSFTPEQRRLLSLFGQQAASALARTLEPNEALLLAEIGWEITTQAASGNLDDLLDKLCKQVGRVMNTQNFMVALLDEESQHLDFRWQREGGKLYPRRWRPHPSCLSGDVITENKTLLLPHGGEEYRRSRDNMPLCGKPSRSWLGVPLRVAGTAIGAIAVQDYQEEFKYGPREERLLLAIAGQVAGAIKMSYEAERKAQEKKYDETHRELRNRLRRFAEQNEDWLWHAVLTAVTHRDGLSFNRALLFLSDEDNVSMQGRMGIGYFSCQETRSAWEEDQKEDRSIPKYLSDPDSVRQKPTPLHEEITKWKLEIDGNEILRRQVREDKQLLCLPSTDLCGYLPDQLLKPPDLPEDAKSYECALIPVKLEDRVRGLLVVDNFVDGEPIRPSDLVRVEELLAEAAEVWQGAMKSRQIQRLGESRGEILALNRQIMGQVAAGQSLKESLEELCRQAKEVTKADCVVIYPYRESGGRYDLELVSHIGLKRTDQFQADKSNKPRQQGVTFSILQSSGPLIVPDVTKTDISSGGRPLAEHDFLDREGIKALIGMPMRSMSGESLGVIYFDYRSSRKFTEQDIALAENIANIATDAISYVREKERGLQDRAVAEDTERLRQMAMNAFRGIQALALSPTSDERSVIRAILQNTSKLFGGSVKVSLAMLEWKTHDEKAYRIRYDYRLNSTEHLDRKTADNIYKNKLGKSIQIADEQPDDSQAQITGNELVTAIRLGRQLVGSLLIQKPTHNDTFSATEQEIVEGLATVAAIAVDNARTRSYLQTVSETVSAITDRRDLKATLKAVVDAARKVAPDIDCVTLWYLDREKPDELVPGPQWGVNPRKDERKNAQTQHRPVYEVMMRREPVWALIAEQEKCLKETEFIKSQDIVSVAAFPLWFGEESLSLGALFLNYRKKHVFTKWERSLFPIFANAAATAIHSAQTIELARNREMRLETVMKASVSVGATLELEDILRGFLASLRDAFLQKIDQEATPYFMLYNDSEDILELPPVAREFYLPDKSEYLERLRLPLGGRGITCRTARLALAQGKIYIENVKNVLDDKDYVEANSKTRSELCAGLVSEGRLLGVLVIKSALPEAFSKEDQIFFGWAAYHVAIALDRVERAALMQRHVSVSSAMAWAADIAHDLNRDLGYIRSRAYWLREREIGLSERGITWVREIDERAMQLADVVRDASAQQNGPIAFFIEDLFREKISLWCERNAPDFYIQIEGSTDCQIYAHKEQTWRALRHLLRNAVEAIEATKNAKQQIIIRVLLADQNQVELQVEDTGRGVSDEVRRRIFNEPFSTKDRESRGFGLLIAQWLIESMGGNIYLYPSASNRGALFAIRLPLTTEEPGGVQ